MERYTRPHFIGLTSPNSVAWVAWYCAAAGLSADSWWSAWAWACAPSMRLGTRPDTALIRCAAERRRSISRLVRGGGNRRGVETHKATREPEEGG